MSLLQSTRTGIMISIVVLSLLSDALGKTGNCKKHKGKCEEYQSECALASCCDTPWGSPSGKYLLKTGPFSSSAAWCDTETNGGGWTVIMRRSSNELDFNRHLDEYEDGFGELDGDFWYGLKAMRDLTTRNAYEMRLDMYSEVNDTVSTAHAFYDSFRVEGAAYTLRLGAFNSSNSTLPGCELPDNLQQFNNMPFTAKVKGVKEHAQCPVTHKGGWWYTDNKNVCVAGPEQTSGTLLTTIYPLVEWYDPCLEQQGLARVVRKWEMKIRPTNCRVVETTT